MEDSHKFVETKTDSLKVGDEVQWMVTKSTRGGFSFSTKYGKITAIEGVHADVKIRNSSKVETIAKRRLVPRSQPSPVNHVFGALSSPEATP